LCLCGCTASHYRTSADKQVYDAIARRTPLVTNMEPRFRIEHTNALVLDGLPQVTVTNDFLGEAAAAELGAHVFSLQETLKIAVQHSRVYQNDREQLFLTALSLTLSQHQFAPLFPGVTIVVPSRIMHEYVWNISRRVDSDIIGTVPWYPEMRNHPVARGRFFTDADMESSASVCVLGADMAQALFPLDSPLGRDVRVGGDYYRVIGVMEPRGKGVKTDETRPGAKTAAQEMFIPLETAKTRFGEVLVKFRSGSLSAERVQLHEVTVKVASREEVLPVAEAVKAVLKHHHKKKDYEVVVPLELLKRAERTKQIFNIVLGSIAAISLLVGGIGIMNIMLATVTERTREIGIRRALGAKRRDIITQFLVEAVMLSGVGGLFGVALGITIPLLVTWFADMKTIITFWSPLIAFSISGLVGVAFGLYPALRAAKMDPVEALRHE
ncbi:MAG TPA: ABC transporter permease, partial [Verrucomicrobiae bacterium]